MIAIISLVNENFKTENYIMNWLDHLVNSLLSMFNTLLLCTFLLMYCYIYTTSVHIMFSWFHAFDQFILVICKPDTHVSIIHMQSLWPIIVKVDKDIVINQFFLKTSHVGLNNLPHKMSNFYRKIWRVFRGQIVVGTACGAC